MECVKIRKIVLWKIEVRVGMFKFLKLPRFRFEIILLGNACVRRGRFQIDKHYTGTISEIYQIQFENNVFNEMIKIGSDGFDIRQRHIGR
jgi:hypothetical protein